MNKNSYQNLHTQSDYAKKIGKSRSRVCQMVKEGKLKIAVINGAKLIDLRDEA